MDRKKLTSLGVALFPSSVSRANVRACYIPGLVLSFVFWPLVRPLPGAWFLLQGNTKYSSHPSGKRTLLNGHSVIQNAARWYKTHRQIHKTNGGKYEITITQVHFLFFVLFHSFDFSFIFICRGIVVVGLGWERPNKLSGLNVGVYLSRAQIASCSGVPNWCRSFDWSVFARCFWGDS